MKVNKYVSLTPQLGLLFPDKNFLRKSFLYFLNKMGNRVSKGEKKQEKRAEYTW